MICFRFIYLEDCKHTIESEALSKWMNQNDEEICLKQCPICKTPILRTQRFLNQVKVIIKDISIIKSKQYGELDVINSGQKKIIKSLKSLDTNFVSRFIGDQNHRFDNIKNLWKSLIASLNFEGKSRSNFSLPAKDIESLNFVVNLFKTTSKFKERIQDINDVQLKQTVTNHFTWLLEVAFTYSRTLSNQQKCDINLEMARGVRILNLFKIMSNAKYKMAHDTKMNDTTELKDLVGHMEALLMSCKVYTLNDDKQIQIIIDSMEEKLKGLAIITQEEKNMIKQAISTSKNVYRSQDHWCKCPYGHIFCTMECGGPIQKSICPECKVQIGG